MSIISQETFDKFTEEEKEYIRNLYADINDETDKDGFTKGTYVMLFGEENLQPEPKIKTWEDVQAILPNHFVMSVTNEITEKLFDKMTATYKISKLIELGYGGMVTEEEWENDDITKYCLQWSYSRGWICYNSPSTKSFLAFHTSQQRKEFMSHESNRKLAEQYCMV